MGRTPWPAAEVLVRLCKDSVEQVFRIRNVFLRSSACLALCLTGCPSNSKTVQERQALEVELKLSQIVIEAREPTVDDDPIWKTSENAPALCNTSSFDHASVDDRAIWDSASSVSFDHDVTVESFVGGKVSRQGRFRCPLRSKYNRKSGTYGWAGFAMRTARYRGRKWRCGVSRRLLSSKMEAQISHV